MTRRAAGSITLVDVTDGMDGIDGVNGINGINGVNGVDGDPGVNGINGVDGDPGVNGINGMNTATVTLFQVSTSSTVAPADPTNTLTYTYATGALTTPNNGWDREIQSVPAGRFLWAIQATVSSNGASSTIAPSAWSVARTISASGVNGVNGVNGVDGVDGDPGVNGINGVNGVNGNNGLNSAIVFLYRVSSSRTSAPAAFSGNFTYTFATRVLTGGTRNGWSTTPPNVPSGQFLWVRQAVASAVGATDVVPTSEFSAAEVISGTGVNGVDGVNGVNGIDGVDGDPGINGINGINGVNGVNGFNTAPVVLYLATNSETVPAGPNGNVTYTFATGASTGSLNGWTAAAPTLSDSSRFLWSVHAVATGTGATDVIPSSEWSTAGIVGRHGDSGVDGVNGINGVNGVDGDPGVNGINGVDGFNTAVVTLFRVSTSSTSAPTAPTGTFTYTFSTGAITGGNLRSWTLTRPTVPSGQFLWATQALARNRNTTDSIPAAEFSGATVVSGTGVNGVNGVNGINGVDGDPGINGVDGVNGNNGNNTAIVSIYRTSTSGTTAPTRPTNSTTWTFATATLTAPNNSWTQTASSVPQGSFLWVSQAAAVSAGATDTIAASEWSAPVAVSAAGVNGVNGVNGVDGDPGINGINGVDGDPGVNGINGINGVDGDPGVNGINGVNGNPGPRYAQVRVYRSAASLPAAPTATITWSNLAISNLTTGWSTTEPTIPATGSNVVYTSTLLFLDATGAAATTNDTGTAPARTINFDGLVTFSNGDFSADGGTTAITTIDGGNITTDTINLNSLTAATATSGATVVNANGVAIYSGAAGSRVLRVAIGDINAITSQTAP